MSSPAGARICRIAEAAKTSKERVYAYFRSKEELHAAVAAQRIQVSLESVNLDVRDVPSYVGELFDFHLAHPEHLRLAGWERLETDGDFGDEANAVIAAKFETTAAAQAAGLIPDDVPALDVLMLVGQLAAAWPTSVEFHGQADPTEPAVVAERRAAVVQAATRLFPPAV